MASMGRNTVATDLVTLLIADTAHTYLKDMTTAHIKYLHRAPANLRSLDMLELVPPRLVYVYLEEDSTYLRTVAGKQDVDQWVTIMHLMAGDIPETDAKNCRAMAEETEDILMNLTNKTLSGGAYIYAPDSHPWHITKSTIRGNVGELHCVTLTICFKIDGTLGVP